MAAMERRTPREILENNISLLVMVFVIFGLGGGLVLLGFLLE